MPEPYEGEVRRRGDQPPWSVIKAATYFELPPILERYGIWAITRDGLHSLLFPYPIAAYRLNEDSWEDHMEEKDWVDPDEFREALRRARALFNAGYIGSVAKKDDDSDGGS